MYEMLAVSMPSFPRGMDILSIAKTLFVLLVQPAEVSSQGGW